MAPATRRGWAAWALVVFGLFNTCASHAECDRVAALLEGHALGPANALSALRAYGTDDADLLRYFAYASAALGRPYHADYIHSATRLDEAPKDQPSKNSLNNPPSTSGASDPERSPLVTPKRALVPYRDYLVEYPPGFFLVALPPALLTRDGDRYRLLFSIEMGLCLTAALGLCLLAAHRIGRVRPETQVAFTLAAVLCLGVITLRRYDAAIGLGLCATVCAAWSRRPALAGIALGMATVAKGVPLLIAPLCAFYFLRRGKRSELWIFLAALAGAISTLLVPATLVAGGHLLDAVRYHADRPLQIESTAAALLGFVAASSLRAVHSFGSSNLVGPAATTLAALTLPVSLAAIAFAMFATWRGIGRAKGEEQANFALGRGVLLVLVSYMITGKVFSPQYLVWVVPLGVLLSLSRAGVSPWLLLALLALTQLIYPIFSTLGLLMQLSPWALGTVLLRNLLLLVWAVGLAAKNSAAR